MNRNLNIQKIEDEKLWDVVIIGGGATGAGIALDAASRGYKTLLVERADFGKATSSRSTKLVHGGVRYLQQGNISLVLEALRERGLLCKNAPHLVKNLRFVVPTYNWWESPFYGIGLKLYDSMAGKYGFGDSEILDAEQTINLIPNLETEGLRGGVIYYDGQFDDSRLLINVLRTAEDYGAVVVNYFSAVNLLKKNSLVNGIIARDEETGKEYSINSKVVINAAGIFVDEIINLDQHKESRLIEPSRGTHLILPDKFLNSDTAIMIPHTDDGRILFAIPWHNRVIVGTTDVEVDEPVYEPRADSEEIDFLLEHAARYLEKDPAREDVLSVFSGLRPLVRESDTESSSKISREHSITVSNSGLITIAGGKWTTFRKMAEDAVDVAMELGGLKEEECKTKDLRIHGYTEKELNYDYFGIYGSDAEDVKLICNENNLYELFTEEFNIHKGEVIWAVRNEMARNVEDFLARRRRALLLNARAAKKIAADVAELMAKELKKDRQWVSEQIKAFSELADNYIL